MADVQIAQTKRQFKPRVTPITTGTRASFPNMTRCPDPPTATSASAALLH